MTAIEEIYKAYGVESGYTYCGLSRDRGYLTCKYPRKELYEDCSFVLCDKCEYKRISSPPFTAEKQLELIKLITSTRGEFIIEKNDYPDGEQFCCSWSSYDSYSLVNTTNKDFTQALTKLVIALKDELDHTKVKEILEG